MLLRDHHSNMSEGSWASMKHTILLIHGLGTNSKVWSEYTSFFCSHGFNVIAPSLRYHDREDSCKELGVVSLLDYIEDLENLINTFETRPIIIGYSMGGLLALKLMEKDLGRLGICLVPAAPRRINAISFSVLRLFLRNLLVWQFWKKPHPPRFRSAYIGALGHLPISEAKRIFKRISSHESGRVGLELGFPFMDPKRASEVNENLIKRPILIIGAEKDKVTPIKIARKVAKKTSRVSDYKEFAKFGHWLMSGEEFQVVSAYCLKWILKHLD